MAVVAAVVAAFLGSECQKFKIISFWENLPIPNRTITLGNAHPAKAKTVLRAGKPKCQGTSTID
jgi:hypothetical protein